MDVKEDVDVVVDVACRVGDVTGKLEVVVTIVLVGVVVVVGAVVVVVCDVDDDDERCCLVANSALGAFPPVFRLAVCLVRAYN